MQTAARRFFNANLFSKGVDIMQNKAYTMVNPNLKGGYNMKFETTDAGKLIEKIDNSNYADEPKTLWKTFYGYYTNPIRAVLSLLINR